MPCSIRLVPCCPARREFVEQHYVALKQANPGFPILIRECSGVRPRLWARYGEWVPSGGGVLRGDPRKGLKKCSCSFYLTSVLTEMPGREREKPSKKAFSPEAIRVRQGYKCSFRYGVPQR